MVLYDLYGFIGFIKYYMIYIIYFIIINNFYDMINFTQFYIKKSFLKYFKIIINYKFLLIIYLKNC